MSDLERFGVIMAGGVGERFWPLSREGRPKQLLCLSDPGRSMLQTAVDLLRLLLPADRIYVITGGGLVSVIQAAQLGIPSANVVGEPCKRNTSGALAYITAHILATHPAYGPEAISLAVMTADHAIGDESAFARSVKTALAAAETHDALVVCGIVPTEPATGFGYIQSGSPIGEDGVVCKVCAFHEKPELEQAQVFLAAGNYYWNSGMFFWKVSTFLSESDRVCPDLSSTVREMMVALRVGDMCHAAETFAHLKDISIDYALMERAQTVLVVPGGFTWMDVGSWPALETLLTRDARGNATTGAPILHECEDCIVYNEPGADTMAVGVIGVHDLVVVAMRDAVLVVPKDRAQEVRRLVEEIKRQGLSQV